MASRYDQSRWEWEETDEENIEISEGELELDTSSTMVPMVEEDMADPGPSGPAGPNQHYLVGSRDHPTPAHSYSVTIGKPGLVVDRALTKKLISYLKGICGAGVVALETNTDGSKHFQCALVFNEPGKPVKFNRNVKRALGWDAGAGTSKHVQAKAKWTESYTFQNVAGGYCSKEDKNPTIWGIHPQFLLQGKVAYGIFKKDVTKNKEISPYNFVPVLFPLGKRKGCKNIKELLKVALEEKYYFHKCGGKLHMEQLRLDYLRFIDKEEQDVDDLYSNLTKY